MSSTTVSLPPLPPLNTLLSSLQTLTTTLSHASTHTSNFPVLQSQLHSITLRVTSLITQTSLALHTFSRASRSSLSTNIPSHITRCHNLALSYADLATELSQTHEHAVTTRAECLSKQRELSQTVAEQFSALTQAREQVNHANLREEQATLMHDEAAWREAQARWQASVAQVGNFATVVASVVSTKSTAWSMLGMGGCAALGAHADKKIVHAREERAVHLKCKLDAGKERLEGRKEMVRLKERMRGVRREQVLNEDVLKAVQDAVEALREMGGVLLGLEWFWKQVGEGGGEDWWRDIEQDFERGGRELGGGVQGLLE